MVRGARVYRCRVPERTWNEAVAVFATPSLVAPATRVRYVREPSVLECTCTHDLVPAATNSAAVQPLDQGS